jgi:RND family efflux transporter MFP subunit
MESRMTYLKPTLNGSYFSALVLTLGTLILGSGISGCGKPGQSAETAPGPGAFPVKVVTVQAQLVPDSTDYLATLKSRTASALQPQVEGQVTKIYVHSGQKVEAGAPILEIDPLKQQATVSNQEANYKSKQATLELNRLELERRKKLYAAGVISRAELDQAQSAYDTARADVDALQASIREQRVQLHYYTVNAPTSGMIGDIPVHVGDRITSQTLVTTLDRGGSLEAYVYIPAEKSAAVRMGMPIDVLDESGKTMLRARVDFISPHVDTGTQALLLKATMPNTVQGLRNDQQVHARIIWSEQKLPVIPVTAVSRLSGKIFAFVVEGQGQQAVAHQKVIRVGDLVGNDYVVLEGIKPGERLIVSNIQLLADGMPVIPQS